MRYEIIGKFIELHEGLIEINETQAKRRITSLAPVGGGIYRIDKPVQFKGGEVIGINYDPPKSLVEFMLPLDEIKVNAEIEAIEEVTKPAYVEVEEIPAKVAIEIKEPQVFSRNKGKK